MPLVRSMVIAGLAAAMIVPASHAFQESSPDSLKAFTEAFSALDDPLWNKLDDIDDDVHALDERVKKLEATATPTPPAAAMAVAGQLEVTYFEDPSETPERVYGGTGCSVRVSGYSLADHDPVWVFDGAGDLISVLRITESHLSGFNADFHRTCTWTISGDVPESLVYEFRLGPRDGSISTTPEAVYTRSDVMVPNWKLRLSVVVPPVPTD